MYYPLKNCLCFLHFHLCPIIISIRVIHYGILYAAIYNNQMCIALFFKETGQYIQYSRKKR